MGFPVLPITNGTNSGSQRLVSQGRPQGELLRVDYWSLMELVILLDSASFLSLGWCQSTTPPATCQHACSPTALPTDRITKLWDSCHFVWWEMGTENFQNTVNRFRWKIQIRKPLDSASGRPVCCGHSTPVRASVLHSCVK